MKKLKITKEQLEKIGITRCEDGQFWKGDFKVSYSKIWCRHKYGNDKYYLAFSYYDADLYAKQMVEWKEGHRKNRPTGIRLMLVHRAVYAWFNGETPDNMDVCHRDDDVENNCIDNLKADTHGNNIRERRVQTGGRPKGLKEDK